MVVIRKTERWPRNCDMFRTYPALGILDVFAGQIAKTPYPKGWEGRGRVGARNSFTKPVSVIKAVGNENGLRIPRVKFPQTGECPPTAPCAPPSVTPHQANGLPQNRAGQRDAAGYRRVRTRANETKTAYALHKGRFPGNRSNNNRQTAMAKLSDATPGTPTRRRCRWPVPSDDPPRSANDSSACAPRNCAAENPMYSHPSHGMSGCRGN